MFAFIGKVSLMSRRPLLLLSIAPAALLAGCAGTANRGLEPIHQPVVARGDYVFDVATNGRGLAPMERGRLAGWMASLRLGYGDRVAIDDPAADQDAREDVATEVARYGLLLSDEAPVTGAPVAPGTVRVVVTRMSASVPGCPDYSHMNPPDYDSSTSSNFGCATNVNLAAMVANPADLVRGQAGAETSDTATATRAIAAYRTAVPTGGGGTIVKAESAAGGTSK